MGVDLEYRGGSLDTHFRITKITKGKYSLIEVVKLFNINDFIIYKQTDSIRRVEISDFLNLKYSGYVFLHKDKYTEDDMNTWINWFKDNKYRILFVERPFPKFNPYERIKFIKYEDL